MSANMLPAIRIFVVLSVLTGVVYPLVVTGIAQVAFPWRANGSLIVVDGKTVGSALIGQPFSDPKHFWGRPSATSPQPYNAASSGASNLGALNPALSEAVAARVRALRNAAPEAKGLVPADLVTASGSGLDPHIGVAAAEFQVERVAKARGMNAGDVRAAIARHTEKPTFGFLGEARVNVLQLNLDLDRARPKG